MAADGFNNIAISEELGVSRLTVGLWRRRFMEQRIPGLYDELRSGGPRSIQDEQVAALARKTIKKQPKVGTHWSCRSIAAETKLPKSTVHRVWTAFGLQPHRQKHFKLSTDPFFVEKVRDIVRLYLNPPDHAIVLAVDEKTQIQALDRTQPLLPLGLGYVEGVTHDHVRHGTTTLFAALDLASGHVLTQCKQRHRHQEFLQFLHHVEASVPMKLDVHLVVDNYCTHKHAKVRRWLAARPRFHVHYTPTYASWLNLVEIWFNIITQRAIRRGIFKSVRDLIAKIEAFVQQYKRRCHPFRWTATTDSILEKIDRLCEAVAGRDSRRRPFHPSGARAYVVVPGSVAIISTRDASPRRVLVSIGGLLVALAIPIAVLSDKHFEDRRIQNLFPIGSDTSIWEHIEGDVVLGGFACLGGSVLCLLAGSSIMRKAVAPHRFVPDTLRLRTR